MRSRWVILVCVLSASSWAEEVGTSMDPGNVKESWPRLRTLIGGFSSGAFVVTSGASNFAIGVGGVAFDVGVQVDRSFSVSAQLRGSAGPFTVMTHVQLAPGVEWSVGRFSAGLGLGGAFVFSANPAQGPRSSFALALPVVLGVTLAERRGETSRRRSVRLNLELALLAAPAPLGLGASVGISVASLTR